MMLHKSDWKVEFDTQDLYCALTLERKFDGVDVRLLH